MKFLFALCIILFSTLLLFGKLSDGRQDMGDYWKKMMENEPMPEAIEERLVKDQATSEIGENEDLFVRDFDIKPNIILYHTHVVSKIKNPLLKNSQEIKYHKLKG